MSSFIHLRAYSDYSLGEGAIKIKDLVKHCITQKMPAVALTDKNNLFAALEFSLEASKNGIQPIIGLDVNVCYPYNNLGSILLLAKNQEGYKNLLLIASEIYLNKNNLSVPNIKLDRLFELTNGTIVICGGLNSREKALYKDSMIDDIKNNLKQLKEHLDDRLYIEVVRHSGLKEQEQNYEDFMLDYAYAHNIPIVATNNAAFLKEDMHEAQDALMCILNGRYLVEDDRPRLPKDFYLKSSKQMKELFSDLPEAIENTVVIAKRCHVMPQSSLPLLPKFITDSEISEAKVLEEQATIGLNERISNIEDTEIRQTYFDRLNFELSVINKMQYPGYFLIVSDFIKWSKSQGIPVGPGRGSGVGSLVAWALQITDLDPLRFGLLFERFLNPDRVSMPDFDIDFCQERREEVIEYVKNKYGREKVAQIITFGKLQPRAVLRDVGRVLQIPYMAIDKICKMVPNNPTNPVTLKQVIELDKELKQSRDNDPAIDKLLSIGLQLEGLNRHVSTHAAGIVIADRPIVEILALYKDDHSHMCAVQASMKFVEEAGLIKFDFLGLKTLSVISWACRLIQDLGVGLDINHIPLDDKLVYQMLSKGDTDGVFQFESAGMKEAIKKLKPDCIEDLIALGSLYRPGPMENIPSYINRKHGVELPRYLHPMMEDILKSTYGIIVYQEQVMEIARSLAGYTLGGADLLRRAMGKKIKGEMEAQRELFINGCKKNNISEEKAEEIFTFIEKFANYGFNKSHAAGYAIISYQTAYLKAHYPVQFLTASINSEINDTDKINQFIQEAKKLNIKILPPDINKSGAFFSVEGKNIRFGLAAIKNVGLSAVNAIIEERNNNGEFRDVFNFVERCNERLINKRLLEGLFKVGAFDGLEPNRRYLYENAEILLRYSTKFSHDKSSQQVGLFDSDIAVQSCNKPSLTIAIEWDMQEKLAAELEGFGFYLSSHPLEAYAIKLSKMNITNAVDVEQKIGTKSIKINLAGVITSRKIRSSPKGKYAFIQLSDCSGLIEISIFNEALLYNNDDLLKVGQVVFIKADARMDNSGMRIIVDHIENIDTAANHIKTYLNIHLYDEQAINDIRDYRATDGKPFNLILHLADGSEVLLNSKTPMFLNADGEEAIKKKHYIKLVEAA